jgi:hypothetical protein
MIHFIPFWSYQGIYAKLMQKLNNLEDGGNFKIKVHGRAYFLEHDVRGSVHHTTIHKEKSNKMQQCIKFYYSTFI